MAGNYVEDNPSSPQESADGVETVSGAVVAAAYTGKYLVWQGAREWVCDLRGKFRRESRPVVGDLVDIAVQADGGAAIMVVHPRRTSLERKAAHRGRAGRGSQVLAANVDQLVIVAATRDPPFREGLVERFLVAAAMAGLTPIICINKADLASEAEREALVMPYRSLSIAVLHTSILRPRGLDGLAEALAGRTSVLVGHSGVGKTSLLNVLADVDMAVAAVDDSGKGLGRHTTSTARMIRLKGGGMAIDSPGVREFGLHGLVAAELARHYPDFRPLLGLCGFKDCMHRGEPGCAVSEAVQAGEISPARYESYLTLLGEID